MATRPEFPVGYHRLHPNVSLNFQMNRFYAWVGEAEMLEEMREASPRIASYQDWKREFLALARRASDRDQHVRSAYYNRAAEFFMAASDPDRTAARASFLSVMEGVCEAAGAQRHSVLYRDERGLHHLPALRLRPDAPRATVVYFGGFDSYMEELIRSLAYLRDQGFDVIAFEGPGQGGALEQGLPMTHDWHKPVAAVLDHFGVEDVALVGLSLGGCLVVRAAAFEPRVRYVVAYDVLSDFFAVNVRQTKPAVRTVLKFLLHVGATRIVNALSAREAARNPVAAWGFPHGMRVTGTATPFDYMKAIQRFRTADVSEGVRQDVLLLAGNEDHYVPVEQLHEQCRTLHRARSVTARLFTAEESAGSHCQVGNYGLALHTIVRWLDDMLDKDADSRSGR